MSQKYGRQHRTLRAELDIQVQAGGVNCARCHEPILPGTPWDLGHRDDDPSQYSGPEHRRCNRGTARIWKQKAEQPAGYGWFDGQIHSSPGWE